MSKEAIKEYADNCEYRWTGDKDRFDYTGNGMEEAVQYLKDIKEYTNVSEKGFSTDGYSIVYAANAFYRTMLWEKMQRMWNKYDIIEDE